MIRVSVALFVLFFSLFSESALWSSTDVSILAGDGYKNPASPDDDQTYKILTLNHASAWEYGDNYFFTDISDFESSSSSVYAEWGPRFSLNKIFGYTFGDIVKDIFIASEFNFASGSDRVEMFGIGVDFNVPNYDYFSINLFSRDDLSRSETTYQITWAWGANFHMGIPLRFTGFLDHVGEEGTSESNTHFQPQLLWMAKKNLGIGIEYQFWENKFGIDGLDESFPQFILKWTL